MAIRILKCLVRYNKFCAYLQSYIAYLKLCNECLIKLISIDTKENYRPDQLEYVYKCQVKLFYNNVNAQNSSNNIILHLYDFIPRLHGPINVKLID